MLVVVALGGNALLRRGEPPEAATQAHNAERAARAIARIAGQCSIVVTHGNGPQVGLLALEAASYAAVKPYPLDVLGAESQGMIGYVIERALRNALPGRPVATLLSQVEVDADDPAFALPTKPIGPVYSGDELAELGANRGWAFAPDGAGFRRVVPSPEPRGMLETDAVATLLATETVVITAGGGGVPVVRRGSVLEGVEAVIDKDMTSALLAVELHADRLVFLTDVAGIHDGWGGPRPRRLRTVDAHALRSRGLPEGSMGTKAEAACRFAEQTGRKALIGALDDAPALLDGFAGTAVLPSPAETTWWEES